jgi:hypothetical protein
MNTFRGSTVIPGAFSTNGMVLGFLLLGGGSMQGYANGTVDAMFVGLLLLILGISVVSLVFPRRKPELQTFLLTYGICVFVGGVSQCYSLDVFDIPQSTKTQTGASNISADLWHLCVCRRGVAVLFARRFRYSAKYGRLINFF